MSEQKYIDLKYDEETLTIEEFLRKENLPATVRICDTIKQTTQIDITQGQEMLLQQTSKEHFAHIKVLKFYDNEKMQTQKGAEYVLEHETFVGDEYLMPLEYPGYVKLVRRPESRGRYLTIKQVIGDCPAFVKVEQDTEACLANDMKQTVTIKAMTILEFEKIRKDSAGCIYAEFMEGNNTYTFNENDKVNFTIVEKDTLYSLDALPEIGLLPKVILFNSVNPEDIVLKDHTSRSAMSTIVEGPIEILGFAYAENITCWTRNHHLKTYETALIPKCFWNKVYVQNRFSYNEEERKKYLFRKFGPCFRTKFLSKSLYLLQFSVPEVTWLRCPDFFKNHTEGNTLYDVIKVPFHDYDDIYQVSEEPIPKAPDSTDYDDIDKVIEEPIPKAPDSTDDDDIYHYIEEPIPKAPDSVDDDDIYQVIEEPIPKALERGKPRPFEHNNSKEFVKAKKATKMGRTKPDTAADEDTQRPLQSITKYKNITDDTKYTRLMKFFNPSRVYKSLDVYDDSLPSGYS